MAPFSPRPRFNVKRCAQEALAEATRSEQPVSGLTHEFYRYPARFSPEFARTAIQVFTEPGDLVLDPFMGGGTTLVEASVLGRPSLGTDVSELSHFLTQVKTTPLTAADERAVEAWSAGVNETLHLWNASKRPLEWIEAGYQRNINGPTTWPIRKSLELALQSLQRLPGERQRRFVRCVLLRTAQWALDVRSHVPSAAEFREQLRTNIGEMVAQMRRYREARTAPARCSCAPAQQIAGVARRRRAPAARLVVTSPPYPGVHVLYHRWQIHGRRETPAPFWIAGVKDGQGGKHYTFGGRHESGLATYFRSAEAAFAAVTGVMASDGVIVQLVGFSEPEWQLPRYLEVMDAAGLQECHLDFGGADGESRLWREVPSRRWYARMQGATAASREVVLFHQPR